MSASRPDRDPGHDTASAPDAHPSPHRSRASAWQVLGALVLAPLAFTLQITASYVLAARVCVAQGDPRTLLLVIHGLAILIAIIGFALALDLWRRTRDEKAGDAHAATDIGEGRTRFLALCGLYGAAIFLVAVLIDASAVALIGPCPGLPAPR